MTKASFNLISSKLLGIKKINTLILLTKKRELFYFYKEVFCKTANHD